MMKIKLLFISFFISGIVFGQSNPYPATTSHQGYLPPIGAANTFLKSSGSGALWAIAPGNPTLFNFLDYGGVADGQYARHASMTSGSAIVTCPSCRFTTTTPAVAGQSFRMDSAGFAGHAIITTILSVTDGQHIVLNTAASTSVGSKNITWGTDNTAALQNALDTVYAHKGGTLYCPVGGYILAGALQTSVNGHNPNCQIFIPSSTIGDTTYNTRSGILIQGVSQPQFLARSIAVDSLTAHTGTWFSSIIDAPDVGATLSPAVFGTISSSGDISYTFISWQNLSIFTPANDGVNNKGTTIGAVNCYYCASPEFSDVEIAAEGTTTGSTQPGHMEAGIITNKINSEVTTYLHNVSIAGHRYALVESDHAVNDNVALFGNYFGLVPSTAFYPINCLKMTIQECAYNIYVPATTYLGIIPAGATYLTGFAQFEDLGATWNAIVYDVNDSLNNMVSTFGYWKNSGLVPLRYNATGMILTPLGQNGNIVNITGSKNYTWNLGDAVSITAKATITSNNNNNTDGLTIVNTNTNSSAIASLHFANDLGIGTGNTGAYLGLLGNTSGSPFNSAFRVFNWSGPVYLGGNGARQMFIGTTGVAVGINVAAAQQGFMESVSTTVPQFSAMYDANHYAQFATASNGDFTLTPHAANAIINTGTGLLEQQGQSSYKFGSSIIAGPPVQWVFGFLQNGTALVNPGLAVDSSGGVLAESNLTINGNTLAGGDVSITNLGKSLRITEGASGRAGQTVLVSGTKTITITGVTTSSRAFITLVSPTGTSLTINYQAVCTSNTLTLQADIAAGTINTADGSTINYFVIN